MNFFKEIQQPVNESRLGIQPDQSLAEDWDSIPDQYKNDIEEFKKLRLNDKINILAKAHIIRLGQGGILFKQMVWDYLQGKDVLKDVPVKYEDVDLDAIYKKAKHDYAILHSDREDELTMGASSRRELQQRAEELAEMKRVTLRNERLHDEEVAFQRAETIQQRKDEMKKIADKYNHELAVINTEHSNNMQAIKTGNNHEINKMNMEYQHEKEMWDKNNPQEKPEYDDEEEYIKPQQSGNKFDQDTGEPIKPAGSQQSNQWHTSQQLTSPTKPTKPGKEDDDITDVEPKPNKPLTLGNNMKKESATARPLPQKPLMAVSMDRWKQAVLNRYPNAKFVTQKMINGVTFAMDETGQVGIYDPKNSYAKVGPAEDKAIKQGVGEAGKPDAYQRDEINATSGFGKNSYAYQMDGGANDEDHEGDAWREKQEKSGTWYIRLNGKLIKDKTGKPYSFHGKAAANKAALTMQAKLFNQGKEFMLTTNPNDKPQGVAEGEEHSPVASAITRRIMLQRHDLLSKYGPVLVTQAIDEVADFVGDVEEIGSSDVSGWIKQVEQMLANNPAEAFGESLKEDLQADDGDHYESADDFFGQFEAESFDNEETSPDGMEVRGYIDGVNVMVWRYDDESMTSGYGYYDDSAMQEGVAEASLAQMRDYFNKPDDSTSITRAPATAGKNPAGVPQEIQNLINKMYHSGKVTPEEFKILQDFQRKTKINVGIKEATTGNAGYDSMLAVMKAVDAGQDATFNLGGEPITLDYNEARFLAGRYKAFLKAGRQEEFLKYMENPMAFDRLMKQLRDLIDKQKNFKGSVQGERGIEEGSERVDTLVTKGLGLMRGPKWLDAVAAIKYQVGERDYRERKEFYDFFVKQLVDRYKEQGMSESMKSLPPVNENEYWCKIDSVAKPIPEGYKRTANGYITRA